MFREDIEKGSRAGSNIELVVPMKFQRNSNVVAMTRSPIIWPNHIGFSSEFLAVLDVAKDGESTIWECLETAQRIVPGDEESWFAQWGLTAKESMRRADIAAIGKRNITASANWLRAANYFRVAQIFLKFDDPRRKLIIEQMRRCARRHLTSTVPSGETVKIPYMSGSIEGYLYWAPKRLSRASLVICLGGEDDFKEALLTTARYAVERGLSLLLVDVPTTSARNSKKVLGYMSVGSWVGACLDYLVGRGDVDKEGIAIYGVGEGASLATQAAILDARFAAVVCDGVEPNLRSQSFFIEQISGVENSERAADHLKRRKWANLVRCPVLVCSSREDEQSRDEPQPDLISAAVKAASRTLQLTPLNEAPSSEPKLVALSEVNDHVFDWIASHLRRCRKSRA